MRLRLLGSGAADGIPGLYSDTRVSHYARKHGGKDVRTRSGALLDGHLKIDLPPDTLAQLNRDGLDAQDWTAVVFTHSHEDHCAVEEIQYALYPFNEHEFAPYAIYGNTRVVARIQERYPDWPLEVHTTSSYVPFELLGYRITPFRANHTECEDCHNLVFERDGRTFIYATDTGIWHAGSWDFLKGVHADALVIECTEGVAPTGYYGHLDVEDCIGVVERLRAQGTLREGARVVTTHHAHQGDATHAELEALLNPHGIEPGYDGLEFDV